MAFSEKAKSTIIIMALMGTLITYVETMVVPALPVLSKFFDASYSSLSWILTSYLISGTVSAAIFGKLADIIGKKKIFVSLAVVYSVAISFGGVRLYTLSIHIDSNDSGTWYGHVPGCVRAAE